MTDRPISRLFAALWITLCTARCFNANVNWHPASATTPSFIAINGGNDQTATLNSGLSTPLTVMITNSLGNPVSGTTVNWSISNSATSGTLSASSSMSNNVGIATVNVTSVGTVIGNYTVTANVTPSLSVNFSFNAALVGMNLQVPIELTDNGVQVFNLATQVFDRTYTSFNTADYDGAITYSLQVMATNSGITSGSVALVDSTSTQIGSSTLSVPASTGSPSFFSIPLTISSSPTNLRIQLTGPIAGAITVYSAKLIVTQVGATKTRIYIPLMQNIGAGFSPTATGTAAALNTYSGSTPGSGSTYYWNSYWEKPTSGTYAPLDATTPWQLEVVLASGAGGVVSAALYDASIHYVGGVCLTVATSPTLVQSFTISDSATYFIPLVPFSVLLTSVGSETGYLYKAGIWAKITNGLSSAQVLYRLQQSQDLVKISSANFSNPTFAGMAVGYGSGSPYLQDCGNTAASSFSACSGNIAGSTQSLNAGSPDAFTSSSISITDGDFIGSQSGGFAEITSLFSVIAHSP